MAPTKRNSAAQKATGAAKMVPGKSVVMRPPPPAFAVAVISWKLSVPVYWNSRNIPIRNPKSPIRLTMNAFLPAFALAVSLYQNPISR